MFSATRPFHAVRTHRTVSMAARATRSYSATASSSGRPSYRDLLRTPVFKSIFLTVVFGLAVIELMRNRKDLEELVGAHEAKFALLNELKAKLRRGDHVDVVLELKMANNLTKYRYNTVTDIQLDEKLNALLKMADEDDVREGERAAEKEELEGVEAETQDQTRALDTKKFM